MLLAFKSLGVFFNNQAPANKLKYFISLYFNCLLINMTTLSVNIKDISQTTIIKKILSAFDVEVIE